MVPEFLAQSFEMLREGQTTMMENMQRANPLAGMPGMGALRAQQEAFLKAMGGFKTFGSTMPGGAAEEAGDETATKPKPAESEDKNLDEIKQQLAELQQKLSKLSK